MPRLEESDIAASEARLGFGLPPDLRAFYLLTRESILLPCLFDLDAEESYFVGEFLPLAGPFGLVTTYEILCRKNKVLPENIVSFGRDQGANQYCYDLTSGEIVLAALDFVGDETRFITRLAPSLGTFLKGLRKLPGN